MRFNFKKIAALAMGALTVGMTMGIAAAASYPAPFVQNGVANVAVVYGTGTGVSALDQVQAGNIQQNLNSFVTSTGGSVSVSGEHVVLQQPSSYLNIGEGIQQVFDRSVTKTDMPTLLADGTYRDSSNNDHDYTQKIDVANLSLSSFNLEDYDSNISTSTPAIGFGLNSGDNVLNYTLTFQSAVNASKMQYTTLNLMGTSYYILDASTTSLTLLDAANSASLAQGGSTTLTAGNTSYSVTATYIDSSGNVKLTVNGEQTDTLTKGETYKLSDGSYIGIKDVLAQNYAGGTSNVEFAIGSGKIVMDSGQDVQINSNSVNGVSSTIGTTSSKISNITISWDTSDTAAITKSMGLTMPAFDGVQLSFSGMNYPANETTTVSNDGNTAVKLATTVEGGSVTLDLLGMDKTTGNFTTIGKDSNNLLMTSASTSLNDVARNNEFVVSGNSGKVAESHVYKVTSFSNTTSNGMQVTLTPQEGGNQITLTNNQGSSIGVETGLTLTPVINYTAKTVNFTVSGTGASFGTLYTKGGLELALPTGSVVNDTSYGLNFSEADSNGNIGAGHEFNVTVGRTGSAGSYETSVTGVTGAGSGVEIGDSNVYTYTAPSALASTINYDEGPTQETATVNYYGSQSASVSVNQAYGQLILASPSATISSSGGSAGAVLVTDAEANTVSSDNLIVVGGSCINSVAAALLGGAYCGASFTAQTGVGSGQYLIKSYPSPENSAMTALLVAGYEQADTANAATYLINHPQGAIDLSKTYIGTTSTTASSSTTSA